MNGTLMWAVKPSLLDYVRRSGGTIEHTGAQNTPDGRTAFPAGAVPTGEWDGCRVLRAFSGALRVHAHAGMLALDIVAPWIVVRDGVVLLTVEDPDDPRGRSGLVSLPDFAPNADPCGSSATVLTAEGAEQFLGSYRAGTGFGDVELRGA